MKTCFLIINYNDYETTKKLLENIKNYAILEKIIVVDNCSTDNSYQLLVKNYESDKIKILKSSLNKGYASGINVGCKYINKLYNEVNIIVSNSDIVIYNEKDIKHLIESKPNDCAIIAPIIKEQSGYNRGWKIPTPIQDALLNIVFIHKYLRPKILFYKDEYFESDLVSVEAVSGCFFVIDSRYLVQVGYFDESTFLYYEENIIAKKIQKINKKIVINTKIEVFHNHSVSIDKSVNHMNKYKELKASQIYFQKVYNNANLFEMFLLNLTVKLSYLILLVIN